MSFIKKLFGKKEPNWKNRPKKEQAKTPEKQSEKPKSEDSTLSAPEGILHVVDGSASHSNASQQKEWLDKNAKIKDEDLVNQSLEILFPRLKRGLVGEPKVQKMMVQTKDGPKEVTIPAEMMMAGFNSGPDFSTCLAIDHDAMFTMVYNKHVTLCGKSKEELLQIAANNFSRVYGSKINVSNTIFQGVYQLQTDGNSEATSFIFPHIWNHLMKENNFKNLFLIMPAQNTVLFWDSITDEVMADMIQKVSANVNTLPKGSLVSNYKYQFVNNAFNFIEQVFRIDL